MCHVNLLTIVVNGQAANINPYFFWQFDATDTLSCEDNVNPYYNVVHRDGTIAVDISIRRVEIMFLIPIIWDNNIVTSAMLMT